MMMSKSGAFGGSETTGNRHTGSGSRSRMHMEGRRMLSGGGGARKGWKRMVASITLLVILVLERYLKFLFPGVVGLRVVRRAWGWLLFEAMVRVIE